jgi:plasmid stabilization system protein ParE
MQISFNAEALAEAEEAARWYLENGGAAPSRAFTLELKRVVSLAAQQAGIASPGVHGTLRMYLKRFPYTVIFRIENDSVRIIAIAHQRRRPAYWTRRR